MLQVFISIAITLAFIACCSCEADGEPKDRYLTLPKLDKCNARFKEAQYKNRNFFYSGHDPELKDKKLDWLDARNTCRDRCMETVSFEDQEKYEFYKSFIEKNDIKFIWTSGRLCDFEGCEGLFAQVYFCSLAKFYQIYLISLQVDGIYCLRGSKVGFGRQIKYQFHLRIRLLLVRNFTSTNIR